MTLRELVHSLSPEAAQRAESTALHAALFDAEGADAPLMVRIFTAGGTWIGAGLAALLFVAMEIYEVVPLAFTIGALLLVAAIKLSRRETRSLAMTQLIWAIGLGAQGLFAGAFAEMDVDETTIALVWTLLNVFTMFMVRVPSFQFASAIAAVCFGTWFAYEVDLPLASLWVAFPVSGLAVVAWIHESSWAKKLGGTWGAIAYGLPVGVTIPLTTVAVDTDSESLIAAGPGAPIATLVVLALIGWVLVRAKGELESAGGKVPERTYGLALIAVVVAVVARNVPGLTLSFLWLLVAHLRRSRPLQGIAIVQLGAFLFFFYYQLSTTLLLKSLWVISTGLVVLWGAYLARPGADKPGVPTHERRSRWLPAFALVLLTTGLVVGSVLQKEKLLAEGQSVLLPLGPRDPRSLIQGDYMVLVYQLEDEMAEHHGSFSAIDRHGRLVVSVDEAGVGHFTRLDPGGDLGAGELRLEYRIRDGWRGRVRVGAESFFFEEGTASLYDRARFGELVVGDDGKVVLVGLRDEHKRPLGLRLHDKR
jgi:uncharacterized membrane-anchored protein